MLKKLTRVVLLVKTDEAGNVTFKTKTKTYEGTPAQVVKYKAEMHDTAQDVLEFIGSQLEKEVTNPVK